MAQLFIKITDPYSKTPECSAVECLKQQEELSFYNSTDTMSNGVVFQSIRMKSDSAHI